MTTLKLYSKIKSNQRKSKERKVNHTRIIVVLFAMMIAIFFLASCATNGTDYQFKTNEDALTSYRKFLSDVQDKKKVSTEDLCGIINTWVELRDTVYSYISKDSSFTAHTYLPSTFFIIHDSIRTEVCRLAIEQDRTFASVLQVKKSTSIYNKEEDIKPVFNSAQAFYTSLDSLDVFKADKKQTLGIYRQFLADSANEHVGTLEDLQAVIRTEDRIFRSFLSHISEYAREPLGDITKGTERLCKNIYGDATSGKLDAKDIMVYMSMRTNRRLVTNAFACVESIQRRDRLTDAQKEAFYWMIIQPFVAIDDFGMAVLTPEQEQKLQTIANEIPRMEQGHKLGTGHRSPSEMSSLLLKLYISTL